MIALWSYGKPNNVKYWVSLYLAHTHTSDTVRLQFNRTCIPTFVPGQSFEILLQHLTMCWRTSLILTMVTIVNGATDQDNTRALLYLMKYGYLAPRNQSAALYTQNRLEGNLKGAVRDFQAFAGLPATGSLDPLTVELMGTPRCGVRDIIGHGATAKRKKRYHIELLTSPVFSLSV